MLHTVYHISERMNFSAPPIPSNGEILETFDLIFRDRFLQNENDNNLLFSKAQNIFRYYLH